MSGSTRCNLISLALVGLFHLLMPGMAITSKHLIFAANPSLPTFAGPTMGTTYRVTLARPISDVRLGQLHRDIDQLLSRIDTCLNTWRPESDASLFNYSTTTDWIEVSPELVEVVHIAKQIQEKTQGRFDITVGPLIAWYHNHPASSEETTAATQQPPAELLAAVGSSMLHVRKATAMTTAALRKDHPNLEIDLGGIGPGYAVDRIGDRLTALGSDAHLVELGGEVRGWGTLVDGRPWRVGIASGQDIPAALRQISLTSGEAVAVVPHVPTRLIIDPRTGKKCKAASSINQIVRAATCTQADAIATANLLPLHP